MEAIKLETSTGQGWQQTVYGLLCSTSLQHCNLVVTTLFFNVFLVPSAGILAVSIIFFVYK